MVEIYFWRFLAKMEMEEIERNTKILGGKEEKEENSRGRLVFFRDLGGLSPFSYERCLELLLLASPYVALLRTPRTGSLGRSRKKGEGCVWKIGAT